MPAEIVAEPHLAIVPADDVAGLAGVIERLSVRPDVDVTKLEKIIELQERILRHEAKAEFDAAFSEMQAELPLIPKRGEIKVNGVLRSRFARYEDIIETTRPILSKHGFSLRHRTEYEGREIVVIGVLAHRSGHSEEDTFRAGADASGGKNDIQAVGSTRTYGCRYTASALLGIATTEDDDGNGATAPQKTNDGPKAPEGFDNWLIDLEATADNGEAALRAAWEKSPNPFRLHLTKHAAAKWASLKTKASAVKS